MERDCWEGQNFQPLKGVQRGGGEGEEKKENDKEGRRRQGGGGGGGEEEELPVMMLGLYDLLLAC